MRIEQPEPFADRSDLVALAFIVILAIVAWAVGHVGSLPVRSSSAKTVCANNLRQMGTVLVSEHASGPWPRRGGSAFLLTLYFTSERVRGDVKIFRCPADESSDIEPGSPEHMSMFESLDEGLAIWPDGITSYAARDPLRFPLAEDAVESQPLACDAGPWHEDGVNVLFDDNKVVLEEWADLGLEDGDGFELGRGAPELLEPLCTRPPGR